MGNENEVAEQDAPEKEITDESIEAVIKSMEPDGVESSLRLGEKWLAKAIDSLLKTGEFEKSEDGQLKSKSDSTELNLWISPFNDLITEEKLLPSVESENPTEYKDRHLEFRERLFNVVTILAEGEWIVHCGLPKINGLGVHIANAPTRKDIVGKTRAKFRDLHYSHIGDNTGMHREPKKYFVMFKKFAELANKHNSPCNGKSTWDKWVQIGRDLIALEAETIDGKPKREGDWYLQECSITRKGKWYSPKSKKTVVIYNIITPKKLYIIKEVYTNHREHRRFEVFMNTIYGSEKYTIEQETRALEKLRPMLTKKQYDQYVITGIIEEKSNRSGLTYYVRKLKPTVVVRHTEKNVIFITALCMHPAAYYVDSFAGSLCPTDDVISHLLYIRGDERRYWKVSNHHTQEQVENGMP